METNQPLLQSIYGHIELTDAEKEAAILEAKIKKYFREKNNEYWKSLEQKSNGPNTNTSAT
jgi:hypothetical protein